MHVDRTRRTPAVAVVIGVVVALLVTVAGSGPSSVGASPPVPPSADDTADGDVARSSTSGATFAHEPLGSVDGAADPGPSPAVRIGPPKRRVLMVGDSTLAAVRDVPEAQRLFSGFEPVLDAQGCRRLVWPSCWSNTDLRVPNTVEEAILATPGRVDVVMVMSGYNDWNDPFGSFVDRIMAAARSRGARQVVFLTLATGRSPGSSPSAIAAYAENTRLLARSASRHPDLVVADWRTFVQRSSGWLEPDGVHLERLGAFGLADYLARWVAHLDGHACPAPLDPGGTPALPCPDPNAMTRVPDLRRLAGV